MLKIAAGVQTSIINENGADFVCLTGQTFPIKDQLSQLGFRWDGAGKRWRVMLHQLLANPSALSRLQTLGIDTSPLSGASNALSPRQPQNWLSRSGVIWYLAKRKEDGQPIVLNKGNGVWNWMLANGEQGSFPEKDIATIVESVRTPDGKPVSGSDPMKLLSSQATAETTKQPEQGPKGRIPPEQISEHQKAIENTFLTSQSNIVMNALAGTGKTTVLRHLASFKPPNEKWLYLVFGKKNQIDSKDKFPRDVEILTSHSFLGHLRYY